MKILNALGTEIQSIKIEPDTIVRLTYLCDETEGQQHLVFAQRADFIMQRRAGELDSVARANGHSALVGGRVLGRLVGDDWQDIGGLDNALNIGLMVQSMRADFEIKVEGTEYDSGKVDLALTCASLSPFIPLPPCIKFTSPSIGSIFVYSNVFRYPDGDILAAGLRSAYMIEEFGATMLAPESYATLNFDEQSSLWLFEHESQEYGTIYGSAVSPSDTLLPRVFELDNSETARAVPHTMPLTISASLDDVYVGVTTQKTLTTALKLSRVAGEEYTHETDLGGGALRLRYTGDTGKWELYVTLEDEELMAARSEYGDSENIPLTGWAHAEHPMQDADGGMYPIDITNVIILEG